jgi:cobalt-zinc-cadmium efflux system membrane fusion protein
LKNPGFIRLGMFATATFRGDQMQNHATVPSSAILHLHDRDWVYIPIGSGHFRRQEVVTGATLPGNQQEIVSGIKPGQQVVSNALPFQNTVEQ